MSYDDPYDITVRKMGSYGPEPTRKLAGLKDTSVTISGHFDGDAAAFKAAFRTKPVTRVTYSAPDGRWQRVKDWLKRHGMRWLKVRHVTYSLDAIWNGEELQLRAAGPIERGKVVRP